MTRIRAVCVHVSGRSPDGWTGALHCTVQSASEGAVFVGACALAGFSVTFWEAQEVIVERLSTLPELPPDPGASGPIAIGRRAQYAVYQFREGN
jgi:hypothetical protein